MAIADVLAVDDYLSICFCYSVQFLFFFGCRVFFFTTDTIPLPTTTVAAAASLFNLI